MIGPRQRSQPGWAQRGGRLLPADAARPLRTAGSPRGRRHCGLQGDCINLGGGDQRLSEPGPGLGLLCRPPEQPAANHRLLQTLLQGRRAIHRRRPP
eukprot:scaffold445711_cov43-Prasinocladus_malaysianus.AAC.1